ncbi:hypothetical protein [Tepidibacter hydrothermalis]|uniref:Uncharacterized protein n=1 Tax=Tepidibacter hydrothermalis TaxID=3036126 RepID=A0ABY8EA54_9FIRM|nr:hypothetical protein [Tepidibacter hydrothermalis]WFD09783.1 hypothetical protein P4S50_15500 [Tepidibacter hydrothermalis]
MNLIGLWSSDIFYYDSFEDTIIGFTEEGTGFITYMRPLYYDIILFKWFLNEDKLITLKGYKNIISCDDELEESKDVDLLFENLSIKVSTDKNAHGGSIDTIEFSQPIMGDLSKFGLLDKDILSHPISKDVIHLSTL